jgi:CubicO group peptidase (beta-lactamase class C family)
MTSVRRGLRLAIPAVLCLALTPAPGLTQGLPAASPESVGLSSERLERVDRVMKEYVDQGRIPGVVTLIARHGKVALLQGYGKLDLEKNAPMQKDTIFRIASMSKAVTSIAALMLLEDGKLLLSDPVSKFIPAYKNTTVAVAPPAGAAPNRPVAVVPAKREITIRDLLTHTSGVSYGSGPAEAQYKAANIWMWYFADKNEPILPVIERLASLPFDAQPGEKYVYGFSTDILGAVIEKASGTPLDEFFRTRIFEPLKMVDTSFFLPPAKADRLAAVYAVKEGGGLERAPKPQRGQGDYVEGPRKCFSAGAGLLSTASDYARFLQMLMNGGELDGHRLLSPKTVELATSNHVGTLFNEGKTGFGLGFEIVEHVGRSGRPGSVGEFSWGGAYYTSYWADPEEQIVAVFMSQMLPAGSLDLQGKFRALVYQAVVGPPTGVPVTTTRRTTSVNRSPSTVNR